MTNKDITVVDGKLDAAIIHRMINTISERAKNIIVTDAQSLAEAGDVIKTAKQMLKQVEEARKSYTSQLDFFKKNIMAQEKTLVAPLKSLIERIKTQSDIYLKAERERQEEARRQAEEAARKAQEAIANAQRIEAEAKARENAGFEMTAEDKKAIEEAHTLATNAVEVASTSMECSGASFEQHEGVGARVTWDYEIIDESILPRNMLSADKEKIKAILRQWKNEGKSIDEILVEGMKIFEKITTVFR